MCHSMTNSTLRSVKVVMKHLWYFYYSGNKQHGMQCGAGCYTCVHLWVWVPGSQEALQQAYAKPYV
jgi:hypothetical protein